MIRKFTKWYDKEVPRTVIVTATFRVILKATVEIQVVQVREGASSTSERYEKEFFLTKFAVA